MSNYYSHKKEPVQLSLLIEPAPEYDLTAKGQNLLSLLSHDPSRMAVQGIIAWVGKEELERTLIDIQRCQAKHFEGIRHITVKRGFISRK